MVQKVLLIVHGMGWLLVVSVTVWRTGQVPPELWTVLPLGVSAILVAFRAEHLTPGAPKRKKPEVK